MEISVSGLTDNGVVRGTRRIGLALRGSSTSVNVVIDTHLLHILLVAVLCRTLFVRMSHIAATVYFDTSLVHGT